MIIRLFRTKYFGQYLALFFFTALLRIDSLLDPFIIFGDHPGFRQDWINQLVHANSLVATIVTSVLLIFQAILLNQVLENNRLIPLNQLLPAPIYVLMMSSSVVLLQPNAMIIVNLILILLLHTIYGMYGNHEPYRQAFDAGLLTGLASLFYFPAILFITFVWMCFLVYQNFRLRSIIITIAGLITPYLFAGFYFFWNDRLIAEFTDFYRSFSIHFPLQFNMDVYVYVIWSLFALLLFSGINEMIRRITANTIEVRRKFRILIIFFLVSLLTVPFSGPDLKFHLMLTLIPLASLLSAYLSQTKKLWFPELVIAVILIVIFVGKMINLM
jgi:hypothetical protein